SWSNVIYNANPYSVTLQLVVPCAANPATATMIINVAASGSPPTIGAITPTSTVCGTPYTSNAPSVTGGNPPYTWSISGQPAGMTIDSATGVISWPTPLVSPTAYSMQVSVTDTGCASGPGMTTFNLTVKLGDFNGDGVVNILDVGAFIDHVLGNSNAAP